MEVIAAHRDYVTHAIRLMIWYAWDLSRRDPPVPIEVALETHVDIMRKTTLFDGRHPADGLDPPIPEWDQLRRELGTRIAACRRPATDDLENDCWKLLEPLIEPHILNATETRQEHGCWSYEVPENQPQTIDLHFANVYRPASPFRDHRRDLIATLLKMIEDAVARHADLTQIQCDSWLNQFPPFADLFPHAWRVSFVPVYDYLATNGWWGQYKDERGAFHQVRAQQFRRTGAHPYSAGMCTCDISQVVAQLQKLSSQLPLSPS